MVLKDNTTKITYHLGMKTIGGTYIEVEHNGYSIYFDFGSIYDPNIAVGDIILDKLIDKNLIAKLDGVYDRRLYVNSDENYKNKAVFISHIHLDHTQMINFIDKEIPVYMSKDTKNLLLALNVEGKFIFKNPIVNNTRNINGVDYDEEIQLGDIKVKFIRVDHDGYGACGFIINTPDVKIAYTGDIRFHGYLKNETLNFIEKAKNADLLIIEGVSVSFDDEDKYEYESEEKLLNRYENLLSLNSDRFICFNYYETNIERIIKLIKISEKYNKTIVLDAYNSYIIKQVLGIDTYYYDFKNLNYDLKDDYRIDLDLIGNIKYIFQMPISNFELLEKIPENSIYFHIDASPLGEFDKNYFKFLNKINDYFKNFEILKCSGHAYPSDLFKIIEEIKPKILTPIHSFRPEMLYNMYGDTILPKRNETILWRNHEKI